MKIKNYLWNGFGFPVVFEELPALKAHGELVPNVDWNDLAKKILEYLCITQEGPFSGSQVKFIRNHLNMSLREFAKFMGVTHQSVMRWENSGKVQTRMGAATEIVLRIKCLRALHSENKLISLIVGKVDNIEKLQPQTKAKKIEPLVISEKFFLKAV